VVWSDSSSEDDVGVNQPVANKATEALPAVPAEAVVPAVEQAPRVAEALVIPAVEAPRADEAGKNLTL
jgi:hypothetical protein